MPRQSFSRHSTPLPHREGHGGASLSWTTIRNYAERWSWIEPDGSRRQGINVPANAINPQRVPFFIRAISSKGEILEGMAVTLKVFPDCHQRLLQFQPSNEIRRVRDYLIIEIDGHHFQTH